MTKLWRELTPQGKLRRLNRFIALQSNLDNSVYEEMNKYHDTHNVDYLDGLQVHFFYNQNNWNLVRMDILF